MISFDDPIYAKIGLVSVLVRVPELSVAVGSIHDSVAVSNTLSVSPDRIPGQPLITDLCLVLCIKKV